jgi:hypothetical protein
MPPVTCSGWGAASKLRAVPGAASDFVFVNLSRAPLGTPKPQRSPLPGESGWSPAWRWAAGDRSRYRSGCGVCAGRERAGHGRPPGHRRPCAARPSSGDCAPARAAGAPRTGHAPDPSHAPGRWPRPPRASPRARSASRTPWPPRRAPSRPFPPEQADLAFATFLLKILAPGAFTRDRPDRASPRKTKKSGDFPARKPGEPSVTNVTRKIEFHLLSPHMIT